MGLDARAVAHANCAKSMFVSTLWVGCTTLACLHSPMNTVEPLPTAMAARLLWRAMLCPWSSRASAIHTVVRFVRFVYDPGYVMQMLLETASLTSLMSRFCVKRRRATSLASTGSRGLRAARGPSQLRQLSGGGTAMPMEHGSGRGWMLLFRASGRFRQRPGCRSGRPRLDRTKWPPCSVGMGGDLVASTGELLLRMHVTHTHNSTPRCGRPLGVLQNRPARLQNRAKTERTVKS
jgi:hypothetical protein